MGGGGGWWVERVGRRECARMRAGSKRNKLLQSTQRGPTIVNIGLIVFGWVTSILCFVNTSWNI